MLFYSLEIKCLKTIKCAVLSVQYSCYFAAVSHNYETTKETIANRTVLRCRCVSLPTDFQFSGLFEDLKEG